MAELYIAIRSLRKAPVFTSIAVLSLALALGANSAVFALIDAVFVRPLPGIKDPQRLVSIYHTSVRDPKAFSTLSWPDFEYYRDNARTFSGMIAYLRVPFAVRRGDQTANVPGELVNDDYFRVLGVQPRLGRDFAAGERDTVAILGERLWRERFGADPAVIGTTVYISARPFTIVGVVPAAYRGVVLDWGDRPEMWIPMRFYAEAVPQLRSSDVLHAWGMQSFLVSGRLKDGVTAAQAADEVASLAKRIDADHPERASAWHGEWLARTLPLGQARFWPGARSQILRCSPS